MLFRSAGEEEGGPLASEVAGELIGLAVDLGPQLGVAGLVGEIEELEEVAGSAVEGLPQVDLGAEAVGLAEDALGGSLIVPEPGSGGQRLELGEAAGLDRKVKDAPRSIGSARRGRGWRRSPPSSAPAGPGAGSVGAR